MNRQKLLMISVLVFAFAFVATSAFAALTFQTTSVTSDGALTLTGAAASTWSTSAGALTLTSAAAATWSTSAGALSIDSAAALNLGNSTATAVSLCNSATCDTLTIGTNTDDDTITIGDSNDTTVSITDNNWSVTAAGVATFVSETVNGAITLANGETIANGTNATVTIASNADTDLTIMGADSSGAANLILDTTGAGAITIGSADVTSITLTTDGTGDGTDVVLPTGAIATAEVLDNTLTTSDLAATLTFADADLVDFGSNVTSATEGLLLPKHATNCATATAEGQVCWQSDTNVLYVGDGAAAAAVAGSTGAANTWTDNQIFTLAGDEDIAITNASSSQDVLALTVSAADSDGQQINYTLVNDANIDSVFGLNVAVTSVATGDADILAGINIANLTSADGTVLEYAMMIGSAWDANLFLNDTTTQVQIADGGTFTFENATGTDFLTLSATAGVLAGDLTVTGGDLTVSGEASTLTIIDNTANAFVLESVTDGLDYIAITTTDGSETLVFGHGTVDSITLTTDGTGTGEVVLPGSSIGSPELTAGAKTHTVVIPVPDPGAANADISAGYVLWTPSVNVTITKVYTAAETAWVGAADPNHATVVVTNAAVGTVATLSVVSNLAVGTNTDMGAITNGAVVAGTNVTIAVTTNGTADAPRQNIQIEYTTTD